MRILKLVLVCLLGVTLFGCANEEKIVKGESKDIDKTKLSENNNKFLAKAEENGWYIDYELTNNAFSPMFTEGKHIIYIADTNNLELMHFKTYKDGGEPAKDVFLAYDLTNDADCKYIKSSDGSGSFYGFCDSQTFTEENLVEQEQMMADKKADYETEKKHLAEAFKDLGIDGYDEIRDLLLEAGHAHIDIPVTNESTCKDGNQERYIYFDEEGKAKDCPVQDKQQ